MLSGNILSLEKNLKNLFSSFSIQKFKNIKKRMGSTLKSLKKRKQRKHLLEKTKWKISSLFFGFCYLTLFGLVMLVAYSLFCYNSVLLISGKEISEKLCLNIYNVQEKTSLVSTQVWLKLSNNLSTISSENIKKLSQIDQTFDFELSNDFFKTTSILDEFVNDFLNSELCANTQITGLKQIYDFCYSIHNSPSDLLNPSRLPSETNQLSDRIDFFRPNSNPNNSNGYFVVSVRSVFSRIQIKLNAILGMISNSEPTKLSNKSVDFIVNELLQVSNEASFLMSYSESFIV